MQIGGHMNYKYLQLYPVTKKESPPKSLVGGDRTYGPYQTHSRKELSP